MRRIACISMAGALTLALVAFGQLEEISAADKLQRMPAANSMQPAKKTVTPLRTLAVKPTHAVVSSASPNRPALTAGGSGVRVNLAGSNLNLLSSAQVMLNEQVVTNVTADLGPPSASSRELTITAQADAAAGNYQLRLMAGSQAIDLTVSILTAVVSAGPNPGTASGVIIRKKGITQTKTGGLATSGISSLKAPSAAVLDKSDTVQRQPMDGETMRTGDTITLRGDIRNAERGAAVADRLTQMKGTDGLRGGLEDPGSGAKGLDLLAGSGDLSARLNAGRTGGGKFDLGSLGDSGTGDGQPGGMESLLGNDATQNPKGTPTFTPGAGDSRLMQTGSTGTSSHIDIMEDLSGQSGDDSSQSVSRTEYHWGPDGSRTIITTNTNDDGSVNQAVIKVNEDGSVEEDNTTTSTSSGESTSSSSSGSGSSSSSSSSTSGGSSSSTSGEQSAEGMPLPDDDTGGGGKTWDELTNDEKQEICDMYNEQRQSVMGGEAGGYSVDACAGGPQGPDWQGLMQAALNPYILHDDAGDSGIAVPGGGLSPRVQGGTQPIPIDPDPDIGTAGGGLTNLPPGSGVDINIPGTPDTSANPDRP